VLEGATCTSFCDNPCYVQPFLL